jgi:hypothetical protein
MVTSLSQHLALANGTSRHIFVKYLMTPTMEAQSRIQVRPIDTGNWD